MKKIILIITFISFTGCESLDRILNGRDEEVVIPVVEAPSTPPETPQEPVSPPDNTLPPSNPTDDLTSPVDREFETYLLVGQSNMVGTDSESFDSDSSITADNFTDGLKGPGYQFGLERVAKGKKVHLLMCAQGGAQIEQFMPGGGIYQTCLNIAKGHEITAVLYSQGEAETVRSNVSWKNGFEIFVASIRRDLNNQNLPIIFNQLGDMPIEYIGQPYEPLYYDKVKQEQASICLPNVRMVNTEGILHTNGFHYPKESHIEIGKRMSGRAWW